MSEVFSFLPDRLVLGQDEVHICLASLQVVNRNLAALRQLLSTDELARAEQLCSIGKRDRQREFISSRGILRLILSRYTGISPEQIEFWYSDRGKPYSIEPANLCFNLSHAQDLALFVISDNREVGVDIESIDPHREIDRLIARFFLPQEKLSLAQLVGDAKLRAFFQVWTYKEAYAKATGQGLSKCLAQFDTTKILDRSANSPWHLLELSVHPEYAASIAVRGHNWQPIFWRFDLNAI